MSQRSFFLGEDQRIFRESLARWLEENWSLAEQRNLSESEPGFSRKAWARLAELGALGAFLPERAGGTGGGGLELMIAMEAFGRALFGSPYLWTIALASPLLTSAGKKGEALLGNIAAGRTIVTVALTEPRGRYDLHHVESRARQEGARYAISGVKRAVPYAGAADFIIVPARIAGEARDHEGIFLFLVPVRAAGVTVQSFATSDGGRAADLTLRDVNVAEDALLGEAGQGLPLLQRAVDLAILAQAAEAVGSMRKLLDSTVSYAKTRQQFGVAIGSFQALQHRMVDMFAATELAASHVQAALSRLGGPEDAVDPREAVMVKLQVDKAARLVGQEAIQIHGGMGMTDDLDVGHHFKRLTMMALTFADQDKLQERYRALQLFSRDAK
jgi:alkylation response protein AidB-like acyl-CoA dehydrogenase